MLKFQNALKIFWNENLENLKINKLAKCHDLSVRHSVLHSGIIKEVLLNFPGASDTYPKMPSSFFTIILNVRLCKQQL